MIHLVLLSTYSQPGNGMFFYENRSFIGMYLDNLHFMSH